MAYTQLQINTVSRVLNKIIEGKEEKIKQKIKKAILKETNALQNKIIAVANEASGKMKKVLAEIYKIEKKHSCHVTLDWRIREIQQLKSTIKPTNSVSYFSNNTICAKEKALKEDYINKMILGEKLTENLSEISAKIAKI